MLDIYKWKATLLRIELFELLGLAAGVIAFVVFFGNAAHISQVYGTEDIPSPILGELIGLYSHPMAWVFTSALLALPIARAAVLRCSVRYGNLIAYFIRVAIQFVFLMAIYKTVMFYINVFNPVARDFAMQTIERSLFGGKLLSQWIQPLLNRPMTLVMSCFYMSWFILVYATVLLMGTHSRRAVSEYTFTAILTFYIGYFTYLLVPVMGPLFTVQYAHPIGGVAEIFLKSEPLVSRDCFPSLHTGLSVVMMVQVWRYRRKWSWFFIPVSLLIVASTIYLRIHYVPDLVAGACLAIATTQTAPVLLRLWEKMRAKAHSGIGEFDIHLQEDRPSAEYLSYFIK